MNQLPTLLVITDNPPIRHWIKKQLGEQYYIIDAHTEKKTLDTIASAHIDFIILDGTFEETDPIALCKKIRNAAPTASFPILLITGRLKKSYRDEALDAGVTDFLSDQLDPEELDTRIATGKKATQVRAKVSSLAAFIPVPKTDPTTSFFKNKVLLHDQAIQFIQQNESVTMLITQIDEFEKIQSKDEILLAFSEFLQANVRKQDTVTPSNDGAFIILISEVDAAECKKIAESLQKKVQLQSFKTKHGPVRLSISVAISKAGNTEKAFNKTIDAASIALRKTKTGKNIIFSLDQEFLG